MAATMPLWAPQRQRLPLIRSRISSRLNGIAPLEVLRDVARHAAAKLLGHRHRRADLAGRAVAALEAVVLDEGLLQRRQRPDRAEALDRRDVAVLILYGEGEAGIDALAVDEHRAAAGALIAAELRAGQSEMLPKKVEQRRADVHVDVDGFPVDGEPHASTPAREDLEQFAERRAAPLVHRGSHDVRATSATSAACVIARRRRGTCASERRYAFPSGCARTGGAFGSRHR